MKRTPTMTSSPKSLYGRFVFPSLEVLLERLGQISSTLFGHSFFNTYLTTQEGEIMYGLTYEELLSTFREKRESIKTLAATSSTPDGKVVRVSVRFDPNFQQGRGNYVIASGGNAQNRAIRDMILGDWVPGHPVPTHIESEKSIHKWDSQEKEVQADMDWAHDYSGFDHSRPTFNLADTFHFDKNIPIEHLLAFIEQLSIRYLNDTPFHAQLETTDGDYYFSIDSQELRYMFRNRRHALFTLFLDVSTNDGQWIDLMLSFHPLHTGPNGEISLSSLEPDGILSLVQEFLSVPPHTAHVPALKAQFTLESETFSVDTIVRLVHDISMDYLLKIPPVAFLSTQQGDNYTGLSLYQLERVANHHSEQLDVLSVGITRSLTGQTMSLMIQEEQPGILTGNLSMNWGDATIQEEVKSLIYKRIGLA